MFVFCQADSSAPKRPHLLTEHQKEKRRERPSDVPKLYNSVDPPTQDLSLPLTPSLEEGQRSEVILEGQRSEVSQGSEVALECNQKASEAQLVAMETSQPLQSSKIDDRVPKRSKVNEVAVRSGVNEESEVSEVNQGAKSMSESPQHEWTKLPREGPSGMQTQRVAEVNDDEVNKVIVIEDDSPAPSPQREPPAPAPVAHGNDTSLTHATPPECAATVPKDKTASVVRENSTAASSASSHPIWRSYPPPMVRDSSVSPENTSQAHSGTRDQLPQPHTAYQSQILLARSSTGVTVSEHAVSMDHAVSSDSSRSDVELARNHHMLLSRDQVESTHEPNALVARDQSVAAVGQVGHRLVQRSSVPHLQSLPRPHSLPVSVLTSECSGAHTTTRPSSYPQYHQYQHHSHHLVQTPPTGPPSTTQPHPLQGDQPRLHLGTQIHQGAQLYPQGGGSQLHPQGNQAHSHHGVHPYSHQEVRPRPHPEIARPNPLQEVEPRNTRRLYHRVRHQSQEAPWPYPPNQLQHTSSQQQQRARVQMASCDYQYSQHHHHQQQQHGQTQGLAGVEGWSRSRHEAQMSSTQSIAMMQSQQQQLVSGSSNRPASLPPPYHRGHSLSLGEAQVVSALPHTSLASGNAVFNPSAVVPCSSVPSQGTGCVLELVSPQTYKMLSSSCAANLQFVIDPSSTSGSGVQAVVLPPTVTTSSGVHAMVLPHTPALPQRLNTHGSSQQMHVVPFPQQSHIVGSSPCQVSSLGSIPQQQQPHVSSPQKQQPQVSSLGSIPQQQPQVSTFGSIPQQQQPQVSSLSSIPQQTHLEPYSLLPRLSHQLPVIRAVDTADREHQHDSLGGVSQPSYPQSSPSGIPMPALHPLRTCSTRSSPPNRSPPLTASATPPMTVGSAVVSSHLPSPPPLDRTPSPLDRTPPPLDRTPPPLDRTPPPLDKTPSPLDRTPSEDDPRGVVGVVTDHREVSPETGQDNAPRNREENAKVSPLHDARVLLPETPTDNTPISSDPHRGYGANAQVLPDSQQQSQVLLDSCSHSLDDTDKTQKYNTTQVSPPTREEESSQDLLDPTHESQTQLFPDSQQGEEDQTLPDDRSEQSQDITELPNSSSTAALPVLPPTPGLIPPPPPPRVKVKVEPCLVDGNDCNFNNSWSHTWHSQSQSQELSFSSSSSSSVSRSRKPKPVNIFCARKTRLEDVLGMTSGSRARRSSRRLPTTPFLPSPPSPPSLSSSPRKSSALTLVPPSPPPSLPSPPSHSSPTTTSSPEVRTVPDSEEDPLYGLSKRDDSSSRPVATAMAAAGGRKAATIVVEGVEVIVVEDEAEEEQDVGVATDDQEQYMGVAMDEQDVGVALDDQEVSAALDGQEQDVGMTMDEKERDMRVAMDEQDVGVATSDPELEQRSDASMEDKEMDVATEHGAIGDERLTTGVGVVKEAEVGVATKTATLRSGGVEIQEGGETMAAADQEENVMEASGAEVEESEVGTTAGDLSEVATFDKEGMEQEQENETVCDVHQEDTTGASKQQEVDNELETTAATTRAQEVDATTDRAGGGGGDLDIDTAADGVDDEVESGDQAAEVVCVGDQQVTSAANDDVAHVSKAGSDREVAMADRAVDTTASDKEMDAKNDSDRLAQQEVGSAREDADQEVGVAALEAAQKVGVAKKTLAASESEGKGDERVEVGRLPSPPLSGSSTSSGLLPTSPLSSSNTNPQQLPGSSTSPGPLPGSSTSPGPLPGSSTSPGPLPGSSTSPGPLPGSSTSPGPLPGSSTSPGPLPGSSPSPGPLPGSSTSPGPLPGSSTKPQQLPGSSSTLPDSSMSPQPLPGTSSSPQTSARSLVSSPAVTPMSILKQVSQFDTPSSGKVCDSVCVCVCVMCVCVCVNFNHLVYALN